MAIDPDRAASSLEFAQPQGADVTRSHAAKRLDFSRKRAPKPTVQFGMRSLLVAISAAAILLAIGSSLSPGFLQSAIIAAVGASCMVFLPVCLGTLALYCSGERRTYFLGAFTALVLSSYGGTGVVRQASALGTTGYIAGYLFAMVVTSLLSGFVAVATRRFADRRGWTTPANTADSTPETPSSK